MKVAIAYPEIVPSGFFNRSNPLVDPDPIIPVPITPKPGYKTTEFWLSTLAAAVGACLTLGVFKTGSPWEKIIGVLSITLAAIGYTAGRSIVKAAALKMAVGLSLILFVSGCQLFNPAATDQQKLDSAKQTYTNANNVITILITTGYIAKNDQALKDAIFQASATIRDSLTKAQEYLTAGNKVTFQFWFDSAMNGLATFLQYQADGERKHKLSNPATRPALPGKVTAKNGSGLSIIVDWAGRGGGQGVGGAATRRYAFARARGIA